MRVTDIRDALRTVLPDAVYHYMSPKSAPKKYIVWGETDASALCADDEANELTVSGEVWLYTDTEYDTTVDDVCSALESVGAAWSIDQIGYSDDENRFAVVWSWEVNCGKGHIYT